MKKLLVVVLAAWTVVCTADEDKLGDSNSAAKSVTVENYDVAESDIAFNNITKFVGTNKFLHFPVKGFDLKNQTVVRMNRDTIYSAAIVNVSNGASITLPEAKGRYMSVMVVQNDHYIDQVFKKPGKHIIKANTEFVAIGVRTRIDPNDPLDGDRVQALQNAIKLNIKATKPHALPNYDMDQLVALRDKLAEEALEQGDTAKAQVYANLHLASQIRGLKFALEEQDD